MISLRPSTLRGNQRIYSVHPVHGPCLVPNKGGNWKPTKCVIGHWTSRSSDHKPCDKWMVIMWLITCTNMVNACYTAWSVCTDVGRNCPVAHPSSVFSSLPLCSTLTPTLPYHFHKPIIISQPSVIHLKHHNTLCARHLSFSFLFLPIMWSITWLWLLLASHTFCWFPCLAFVGNQT